VGWGVNVLICRESIMLLQESAVHLCLCYNKADKTKSGWSDHDRTCAREHSTSCTLLISNPGSIVRTTVACFFSPSRSSFDFTLLRILYEHHDRSSEM
jgi:hypothetical protein